MTQDKTNPKDAKQDKKSGKKSSKVFGLMTKRRWFAVAIFLCSVTWSYTAGPPLNTAYISNGYYRDPIPYDYSTVSADGNRELVDFLFTPPFWKDLWISQIGSHYGEIGSMLSFNDSLIFSDVQQNYIFSYTPMSGTQIFFKNFDDKNVNKNLLNVGPSGLLQHPKNPHSLYISHLGQRNIILYDTKANKTKVVATQFDGKRLNGPKDLILSPDNKYIYFTDPPHSFIEKAKKQENEKVNVRNAKSYIDTKSEIGHNGIYRIAVSDKDNANKDIELLDSSLQRPNYLLLSKDKKLLYVSNCIQNEFEIHVFEIDQNMKIKPKEIWNEKKIFENNSKLRPKTTTGCVGGMALHPKGYLIATCYENRLCILNEQTGKLEFIINLANGVHVTDVAIATHNVDNKLKPKLYIGANYSVWQMKLNNFN